MKTLALHARVFIHCFLVFGYPGETLALVVHILHKGPVTLLRMRETYDKRMKINEIIFIRTKSFEMTAYEYRTFGVPLSVFSVCLEYAYRIKSEYAKIFEHA